MPEAAERKNVYGTILLGVDVETPSNGSVYARCGAEMFAELGADVTWYVTGTALQAAEEAFAAADGCEHIDVQIHTYDHILWKSVLTEVPPGRTVCGKTDWFFKAGASPARIADDLDRCVAAYTRIFNRPPQGLTCPWGYYRGLGDRPDLLGLLSDADIRYVRSFARNETDGQPVPLDWQPFFYSLQGFPDLLELLVHDYQDDYLYTEFTGRPAGTYPEHLRATADRVAADDLVWSMASHDHACDTPEKFATKTSWMIETIRYARSLGIAFLTGGEDYRRRRAQRPASSAR
jgi:hypothetical protein